MKNNKKYYLMLYFYLNLGHKEGITKKEKK